MNNEAMQRLSGHIETVPERFRKLSSEQRLRTPAPGKWSPQEILGHLVDSAINNLQRFTEIQFMPQPFRVTGYRQVELVKVNQYQQLPPEHILALWQQLNRQIVYVVNDLSPEKFLLTVNISSGGTETLEWLITDYVDHMEHHLRQIFELP